MDEDRQREEGPGVSVPPSESPQVTGPVNDSMPSADHADFVEVRSAGLRAVRDNLARRKKA